jgi:hypothetical protein
MQEVALALVETDPLHRDQRRRRWHQRKVECGKAALGVNVPLTRAQRLRVMRCLLTVLSAVSAHKPS